MQFVVLSMEGPDLYSLAGGLGVRSGELAQCLADLGFTVHLYFVGDPNLEAVERKGNLVIHRWCQWLSAMNPGGVYIGQAEKIADLEKSWPDSVIQEVVKPGVEQGLATAFLIEEWQMASTTIALGRRLEETGYRHSAVILWNANNLYGFDGINWTELQKHAVVTTVSRYMKHRMWVWGVNPIVIHNGIPSRMVEPVPADDVAKLREVIPGLLLTKVGRYDVDKRWIMAVQGVGKMKRRGMHPTLIARGGKEYHRNEVLACAEREGLNVVQIRLRARASQDEILAEFAKHPEADVFELCFYVSEEFIRVLYAASDCVLANSGHEPFGLVGLEVMGCGGVALVGSTGEDYAQTSVNAVVMETEDSREIVAYMMALAEYPEMAQRIRENARVSATYYEWNEVAVDLLQKVRYIAITNGIDA